jgi:hypothetical protein
VAAGKGLQQRVQKREERLRRRCRSSSGSRLPLAAQADRKRARSRA